jgi:peroxiredoxin
MSLTKSGQTLKTGEQAPEFSLPAIDGKTYSPKDFPNAKALLIIFMCNHCPFVIPKVPLMNKLYDKFKGQDLIMIGINSNNVEQYPEDNFENMKKFAQEQGIEFIYAIDETQETAKAYGATCTPDPFLFDADKKLVYHGRFNDALDPDTTPTTKDMEEAIEAVLQGKKPQQEFLYSMGCNIKWK